MACSPTRRAALQMLQKLVTNSDSVMALLGLEPLSRGRACFRSALGRCAGACCGSVRAWRRTGAACWLQMSRLQLVCAGRGRGPCAGGARPGHDAVSPSFITGCGWAPLNRLDRERSLTRLPAGFDQDGYKILRKPLLSGDHPLHPLAEKPPLKTARPCPTPDGIIGQDRRS